MIFREATMTLTVQDYVSARRLHFGQLFTSRPFLLIEACIFILYCGFLILSLGHAVMSGWREFANIGFLLLLLLPLLYWRVIIPIETAVNFRTTPALAQPLTYRWDTEALTIDHTNQSVTFDWSEFRKWAENETSLLLYRGKYRFHILPKRAFTAEQIVDIKRCSLIEEA